MMLLPLSNTNTRVSIELFGDVIWAPASMTYTTRVIKRGFQSPSFVRGHLNWKIFSPGKKKTKPKTKWSRRLANNPLTFLYAAAEIWLIDCCENGERLINGLQVNYRLRSGYIQLWSLIANCLVLQLFLCSLPVYQRLTQQPLSVTLWRLRLLMTRY